MRLEHVLFWIAQCELLLWNSHSQMDNKSTCNWHANFARRSIIHLNREPGLHRGILTWAERVSNVTIISDHFQRLQFSFTNNSKGLQLLAQWKVWQICRAEELAFAEESFHKGQWDTISSVHTMLLCIWRWSNSLLEYKVKHAMDLENDSGRRCDCGFCSSQILWVCSESYVVVESQLNCDCWWSQFMLLCSIMLPQFHGWSVSDACDVLLSICVQQPWWWMIPTCQGRAAWIS